MTHYVYIIYSETLSRYYVGHTIDLDSRLSKHLSNHSGYTAHSKDWLVVYVHPCGSKTEAIKLEGKIKKRGIARYLDDLNRKSG